MSRNGIAANKLELLMIAKAVADEKSIDQSIVLEAIEEAIQKARQIIRSKRNTIANLSGNPSKSSKTSSNSSCVNCDVGLVPFRLASINSSGIKQSFPDIR